MPLLGPAAAATETVEVRPGDSLWAIARRNGTTVERLRTANGLQTDLIRPGQKLRLPTGAKSAASPGVGLQSDELFHGCRVRQWLNSDPNGNWRERATIELDGKVVQKFEAQFEVQVEFYPAHRTNEFTRWTDVTGDGRPKIFIRHFTEARRYIADLHVFVVDRGLRHITTLEHVPCEGPRPPEPARPGELLTYEFTGGGRGPRVEWPTAEVALRFGGGKFQVDPARQLRPATLAQLKSRYRPLVRAAAQMSGSDGEDEAVNSLFNAMGQDVFGGNSGLVEQAFEAVWPPERAGGKRLWQEFAAGLRDSHYLAEINRAAALATATTK